MEGDLITFGFFVLFTTLAALRGRRQECAALTGGEAVTGSASLTGGGAVTHTASLTGGWNSRILCLSSHPFYSCHEHPPSRGLISQPSAFRPSKATHPSPHGRRGRQGQCSPQGRRGRQGQRNPLGSQPIHRKRRNPHGRGAEVTLPSPTATPRHYIATTRLVPPVYSCT